MSDHRSTPGLVQHPEESNEYFFEEGCHILELLNSPEHPEASIARARVAPGDTTEWHLLSDTIERYVILEGSGIVSIGYERSEVVNSGDVVVIPSGCPQRIRNTGIGDLVFLAICTPRFSSVHYQRAEPREADAD